MPDARFLQIHSLHGYSAALLNRDDSGLAKRMPYGGTTRTRVSSQCLKRHWRVADDVHALQRIDGATAAVRSRETVTRRVIQPLKDAGHDPDTIQAIETAFQIAVSTATRAISDRTASRCCSANRRFPISRMKPAKSRRPTPVIRKRLKQRRRNGLNSPKRT